MTEKLYYSSSMIFNFTARVIGCKKNESGYDVLLDKTAFFPESGGQCCDTGKIGNSNVLYVFESSDDIIHTVDTFVSVGEVVECSLDFAKRFRNMQNHTGEHIISGLIHKYFGFENVGFHLGTDNITADFNGKLTRDDLLMIEKEANIAVVKNAAVTAWFPEIRELSTLEYRCKSDIKGDVRLVKIDGFDLCACCAPHVENCGQIGIVKILDFEAYKGGTRINIKCGFDALFDYNVKYFNVLSISALLSAKQNEVAKATEHLKAENDNLKREIKQLKEQILRADAKDYVFSLDSIIIEHTENDMNELRIIADAYADKTKKLSAAVFYDNGICTFTVISKHTSLDEFTKLLRNKYSARCGGKDNIVQGSVETDKENFKKIVSEYL